MYINYVYVACNILLAVNGTLPGFLDLLLYFNINLLLKAGY